MALKTARVAAVILLALAVRACSTPAKPQAQDSEVIRHGRQIYLAQPCPTCHGQDRMGATSGPPIRGLRGRWTEESLVRFLRNPSTSKQADSRLKQLSERYRSDMPALILGDETRVRVFVAYLLQD